MAYGQKLEQAKFKRMKKIRRIGIKNWIIEKIIAVKFVETHHGSNIVSPYLKIFNIKFVRRICRMEKLWREVGCNLEYILIRFGSKNFFEVQI